MPANTEMNKKKIIFHILPLIASLSLSLDSSAGNYWITNDNAVHNIVWKEKLSRRIDFLSDTLCKGRATGTRGIAEAGFYICDRFKSAGLLPFDGSYSKHFYAGKGLVGHNLAGVLPGAKSRISDSYIVIGAHYDHLGILDGKVYPGADANASGVAAMISIAEMFSAMRTAGRIYGTNIIFVAFDAKELNMAGSESFVRMIENGELTDPISGRPVTPDKIRMMINIDQIGSSLAPLESGREDYLIMLGKHTVRKEEAEMLGLCNRFYGTNLELSDTYYGSENFTKIFYDISDQKAFAAKGIPAVFFTSGITMNTFKTYDTPQTLNLDVLRRRIILIYHWVEKLLK